MNREWCDLDEKTFIGNFCVSTVRLVIEHPGGMWYETMIFPAVGEEIVSFHDLWMDRYRTREEAVAGHEDACERLRNGELEVES